MNSNINLLLQTEPTPHSSDSSSFQTVSDNLQASHDFSLSPPKCNTRTVDQEMNAAAATPSTITPLNVTTSAVISNLYTPLVFLPPDIASSAQNTIYVQVGTLGMFIWDILMNLRGDYQIIVGPASRHAGSLAEQRNQNRMIPRIGLPTVAYFISRIMTLGFQLGMTLFLLAPVPCTPTAHIVEVAFFLSKISTTLMFFFRVNALYYNHPYIRAIFFSLWIITVGLISPAHFMFTDVETLSVPGMQARCLLLKTKRIFALIPAWAILLHDTSVFLAISYKLYRNAHLEESSWNVRGLGSRTGAFFFPGKKLPPFSRALLKDGQVYYLVSSLCSTVVVALLLATNVNEDYRLLLIPVEIAVINSTACHVFRNVKLGRIQNREIDDLSHTISAMQFHGSPVVTPVASGVMVTSCLRENPSLSVIEAQTETDTETQTRSSSFGMINDPAELKRDGNTL
ncbi:hypothetical protein D9758_017999 [Tetrapyrgos nigripes]|uniref:Uncharacterized protein n=1 Tax=Tetrapyrgos nigripes TaxID=182062 RepID=A0A8H5BSP8_9AGAR|nr:hypothetical protein D9758_017999 [Tetrapyrgos nigripes]